MPVYACVEPNMTEKLMNVFTSSLPVFGLFLGGFLAIKVWQRVRG